MGSTINATSPTMTATAAQAAPPAPPTSSTPLTARKKAPTPAAASSTPPSTPASVDSHEETSSAPKLDWVKPAAPAPPGSEADALNALTEANATYPIADAKSYPTQYAAITKGLTTLGYFKSLPSGQQPTDPEIQQAMAQYRLDAGLDPKGTPLNPQTAHVDDLFRANLYQDYHWHQYQTYKNDPRHVSNPGSDDDLQFVDPQRLRGLPQGLQLIGDRNAGTLTLADRSGHPLKNGNGEEASFPVSFGMNAGDADNKDHQNHQTPAGNGYVTAGSSTANPTWVVPDHGWGAKIIDARVAKAAKEGRTITREEAARNEASSPPGPYNPMGPRQIHINGLPDNAIYFHSPSADEFADIEAHKRASHGCARNLPQNVQLLYEILEQQRSRRMPVHIH